MAKTIPVRVKFRSKTDAEWSKDNPVIPDGEIIVVSDVRRWKFGDGKAKYNDLPYQQGVKGDKGDPAKITKVAKDAKGNTMITFNDGTTITVDKGDQGEPGSVIYIAPVPDAHYPKIRPGVDYYLTLDGIIGLVKTVDVAKKTIVRSPTVSIQGIKGDKGDPLRFEDLTPEQIEAIRGQAIQLDHYVTKKDHDASLLSVSQAVNDVSKELEQAFATVEKTYQKKTDPITLTDQQKQELKGDKGDKGDPGENVVNTRNNSQLKYWCGPKSALPSYRDANTIYDVWE